MAYSSMDPDSDAFYRLCHPEPQRLRPVCECGCKGDTLAHYSALLAELREHNTVSGNCDHCASPLVKNPLGDLACNQPACFLYDPSTREHGSITLPNGQILCPTYEPGGSMGDICPVCGLMPPDDYDETRAARAESEEK